MKRRNLSPIINRKTKAKVAYLKDYQGAVFGTLDEAGQRKILHIQTDIEERLISIKTNVYEIGKLLHEAKEKVLPHGEFQKWIEETFGDQLPYPTAALYKSIYQMFKGKPQVIRGLPVTFLLQIKQDTFPEEIRKLVLEHPEAFKESEAKEASRLYQDFKDKAINLKDFVRLAKKQIEIGMAVQCGESHARHGTRTKRTLEGGFKELTQAINKIRKYARDMISFFPPPEDEVKTQPFLNEAQYGRLIRSIDETAQSLHELKNDIEQKKGFFRDVLVVKDGVVKKDVAVNL